MNDFAYDILKRETFEGHRASEMHSLSHELLFSVRGKPAYLGIP